MDLNHSTTFKGIWKRIVLVFFRQCKVGLSEFNKYSACYVMVSIASFVKNVPLSHPRDIGDFHEIFLFIFVLFYIFVILS